MSSESAGTEWVLVGGKPGEIGHCTRCGQGLSVNLPQKLKVIAAIMEAFADGHSTCSPGEYFEKPARSPEEWLTGRDTGTSSLTIYSAITGNKSCNHGYDIPHDPDDFGRCYRLLKLFPNWRPLLPETISICGAWKPFVEHWDELTEMYEYELEHGSKPDFDLYKRIAELRGKD